MASLTTSTHGVMGGGGSHIADHGSSQGKNSLSPMPAASRCLRPRAGNERSVMVVHVDQHANDFNTLFDVLHRDPERYALDLPRWCLSLTHFGGALCTE
jgi:hypothetical protein